MSQSGFGLLCSDRRANGRTKERSDVSVLSIPLRRDVRINTVGESLVTDDVTSQIKVLGAVKRPAFACTLRLSPSTFP